MNHTIATMLVLVLAIAAGCGDKSKTDGVAKEPPPKVTGKDAAKDAKHGAGHGGKVIALGEGVYGPYRVKATRDEGDIKPGGDAPIDVWVDPADASAPKVVAVRFWVGPADAQGSARAKAEIEDPKDPNRWHTHADVPNPLPPGSKLWVEIEDEKGARTVASFDLKA